MATFLASIRRKLEIPARFEPAHTLYAFSILAVFARLALFVIYEPYREGDTQILVGSVRMIRGCLSEGRFLGCSFDVPFPILQYVPSIILSYLGFSESAILHFLAYLSFLAFLASIALIFWTLKRKTSKAMAVTAALLILTGPLLWYSHSTYGEMVAAFLILAFTAASLLRVDNRFLIPLFFLAGVTKEVAFPFLLLIGGLCLLPEIVNAPVKIRGRLYALLAAAVPTVLANVAFNYFRFGTYYDAAHLTQLYLVPTFRLHLSFFLAMWFSPYGGLLFFWPSFVLLYFAVVGILFYGGASRKKRYVERDQDRSQRLIFYLPISVISVVLFLVTAGFSRWCTPLGGAAWGPRYILPWIPAVSLLLLYFYAREIRTALSLILSKTIGLIVTSIALVIVSLPQLMVLFGPFVMVKLFDLPPGCPRTPIIEEDVTYYYRCIEAQIWPGKLVLLESFPLALKPSAFVFAVFYCVILVGGCVWIRKLLTEGKRPVKADAAVIEAHPVESIGETATQRAAHGPMSHWLRALIFYTLLFTVFFSAVLFSGHQLLAPGDGVFIYLPNFFTKKALWDALILSGFPRFADPQVMMWYLPAQLLSYLPGGWNAFILMVYVLASGSMYGYVYTLTRSHTSALASGTTYGMSGFMMAHLGHTGIIHCAAWLPLIIWSLEMLRRRWSPFWLVTGSLAVGLCFLAGQTQIFFYSLLLSVGYAVTLGRTAPVGQRRYYLYALLLVALGVGLAAIQLIPTTELVNQSVRTEFSFEEFVSYSLTPKHLITFVFPYLFGFSNHPVKPYFGDWNLTELAGYVGLLPLMLAAIGFASSRRNLLSKFWLGAGLIALLLALGSATPLAHIIYYAPIISRFRAPARHLLELTFSVSVLAGLGLSAIRQGKVGSSLVRRIISISALAMLACLIAVVVFRDQLAARAASAGVAGLSLLPWANGTVGIPLLIFLCASVGLAWWCGKPNSFLRTALLMLVLLIDLASFGWFYEWRYASPDVSELSPPASAVDYRQSLSSTHQRILPVQGIHGPRETMPPNTSRLWGIPSATGANVLRLERTSRLLSIAEGGDVDESWRAPENLSVNLMAIRYVFATRGDFINQGGVSWLKKDLNLWIGTGCKPEATPLSLSFDLPKPFKATKVGLVSILACATGMPDGKEVARLSVTDADGRVQTQTLLAGRDASEWSYDCNQIKPLMKHKKATIFDTYPSTMYEEKCVGHHYVTMLGLENAANIKSVSLEWTGGAGALIVEKISLIDDATGVSYGVNPEYLDSTRFQLVDETAQTRVYENLRAMPRAWLAQEALELPHAEDALKAIKTSRLPDGGDFDPARTALVEEPLSLAMATAGQTDKDSAAEIVSLSDTVMEVRTRSAAPSVLVTSDPYYPGWEARVDGQPARLLRTDYALRGVGLPAGEHLVRFEFRPESYYYGAAISLLSLLALVVILLKGVIAGREQVLTH